MKCLSICLQAHLSDRFSICPSVFPSNCPTDLLTVCPSVNQPVFTQMKLYVHPSCPFISLSACLSICFSACPSVCMSVCLSVFMNVHLTYGLSICPSTSMYLYMKLHVHSSLSVCLSICFSTYPSTCPSVCLSICLPVHLSVCIYERQSNLLTLSPSVNQPANTHMKLSVQPSCPFISISVCLSICSFVHLSIYLYILMFHF
jgi:hypothetical protein